MSMFGLDAAEGEYDPLDDWYDKALADGMGFKTEEEKQKYLTSLGDFEKHPLFANAPEDLKSHPLTEAFRSEREDGKNQFQLAEAYKQEGNDWIKGLKDEQTDRGKRMIYIEAWKRYTQALSFVSKVDVNDSSTVAEEEIPKIQVLHSQILSNRAMCSLSVTDFGKCKNDCNEAIKVWPSNDKAHYRLCKALASLRYWENCLEACNNAQNALKNKEAPKSTATSLSEIQSLKSQAMKEVKAKQVKMNHSSMLKKQWEVAWACMQAEGLSNLGYFSTSPGPVQARDMLPHYDSGRSKWPVLWMYPQHNQFDLIHAVDLDDLLVEHLVMMFPLGEGQEEGLGSVEQVEWDTDNEYTVSSLVVYVRLDEGPVVRSKQDWVQCCAEHRLLQTSILEEGLLQCEGDEGISTGSDSDSDISVSERQKKLTEKTVQIAMEREKLFHDEQEKQYQRYVSIQDQVQRKRKEDVSVGVPSHRELNAGCTFRDVLAVKGIVLMGGLLKLLVFVRGNKAHQHFLETVMGKFDSGDVAVKRDITIVQPTKP